MKKQIGSKKLASVLLAGTLLLSGCGSKKKPAAVPEATDSEEEIISVDAQGTENPVIDEPAEAVELTSLAETLGDVPSHLTREYKDPASGNSFLTDADVILPALGGTLPLYYLEPVTIKDVDTASLINDIFDDGTARLYPKEIYMDRALLSYWAEELDQLKTDETLTDEERTFFADEHLMVEFSLTSEDRSEYSPKGDLAASSVSKDHGLVPYKIYSDPSSTAAALRVLGQRDGKYYILELEGDDTSVSYRLTPASLSSHNAFGNLNDFSPNSIGYDIYLEKAENAVFSREEAEQNALSLAEEMGYSNFAVSDSRPFQYNKDFVRMDSQGNITEVGVSDVLSFGWRINLTRHIGGLTIPGDSITDSFYQQSPEGISIIFMEDDYVSMQVRSLSTAVEADTCVSQLLPFDSMLASAEHYMQNVCQTFYAQGTTDFQIEVEDVRLGCYPCQDEEGRFILVPAWFLGTTYESYRSQIVPLFIINAIDGSLIYSPEDEGDG